MNKWEFIGILTFFCMIIFFMIGMKSSMIHQENMEIKILKQRIMKLELKMNYIIPAALSNQILYGGLNGQSVTRN